MRPAEPTPTETEMDRGDDESKVVIDASLRKSDVWWTDRLQEERQSQALDAAPVETPATEEEVSVPSQPQPRTSRYSSSGSAPSRAKVMTTAQLKSQLRDAGVAVPEGATRPELEQLLTAQQQLGEQQQQQQQMAAPAVEDRL